MIIDVCGPDKPVYKSGPCVDCGKTVHTVGPNDPMVVVDGKMRCGKCDIKHQMKNPLKP